MAAAKMTKRTIGLIERAMISDQKKGYEASQVLVSKIADLKKEQIAIDLSLVKIRNPDNVMLNVYIDLHGLFCEQGKRVLFDYLRKKQDQLCKGELQPNCDTQTHIIQVITGDGKLELAVKDFLSMAGYSFYNRGGAFLVRLTTNVQDANANMARVGLNKELLAAQKAAWEQEKAYLTNLKKERKAEFKSAKYEEKSMAKAAKIEEKTLAKANKAEEKAANKAQKQLERTQHRELKHQNHSEKQEVKQAMIAQGFTCFQIKQIRIALGDKNASLKDCETYATNNNIRPAKVEKAASRQQPQDDDMISMKSK